MKKNRHNKRRNTAILYETLIRQLTKSIMYENKDEKRKVICLLKEFFGKKSILSKELVLYKTILECKKQNKEISEKILNEVKRTYFALNQGEIYNQQSKLVKKINKDLHKDIFQNFVPNYKDFATINQIFSKKTPPKERVLLEVNLVEKMSKDLEERKTEELKPLDKLTYKTFMRKYNEKYGKSLIEEQKKLLSYYVSSFVDNQTEFRVYLNEEIERLKGELKSSLAVKEIKEDSEMTQKTNQVYSILENFNKTPTNEDSLKSILKIQKLVEEIKND